MKEGTQYMRSYSVRALTMAGALLSLGITACGTSGAASAPKSSTKSSSAPASSSASSSGKLTTVTMRLDWIPVGYEAPFVYGATSGIYKKYGINLKWAWGTGSAAATEVVDTGKAMFSSGDANSILKVDASGGNVVAVFGWMQVNPDSIIVPASSSIKTVKDLEGKTISASAGSSTLLLLPAVLQNAGVPASSVHIENMSSSAKTLALLNHKVSGTINYGFETAPELAAKGMKARLINYADYGVNPINLAIITTKTEIQKDPALVKAFVEATDASIIAAEQHPKAAEQAVIANANGTAPSLSILEQQWTSAQKLLQTANDKGHPLGYMSSKDWQNTLALGQKYLGLKASIPVSQVFTNQFIPSTPPAP